MKSGEKWPKVRKVKMPKSGEKLEKVGKKWGKSGEK